MDRNPFFDPKDHHNHRLTDNVHKVFGFLLQFTQDNATIDKID